MDEHIEAVQRMQDYIQMNLDKEITMADLARVSMYSPWYSYRLFVQFLSMTPAVYIRRLRLSKSALRLRDEKIKIVDVSFDAGFESVDGYQRAFLWSQIFKATKGDNSERSQKCICPNN